MSDMPFFSIIVPVYNAQDTLERCIRSVLDQSFKSFELLLIDDGSVDDSPSVCDAYSEKDDRIKVVHKTNSGEFDARKVGIDMAIGKYITGVDADDYYADNYLDTIYSHLKNEEYDIAMWSLTMFGAQEGTVRLPASYIGEYSRDGLLKLILETTLHSFVLKAFRADLIKAVDYTDAPKVRFSADYCLTIPAVLKAKNSIVFDYYGYMYYIHGESQSHSIDYSKLMDLCRVSEYGLRLLEKNGLSSEETRCCEHIGFMKVFFDRMMTALEYGLLSEEQITCIIKQRSYLEAVDAEREDIFGEKTYGMMKMLRNYRMNELLKELGK